MKRTTIGAGRTTHLVSRTLAGLLASALVLSACGGSDEPTPATSEDGGDDATADTGDAGTSGDDDDYAADIDWRQFEGESIVFGGLQHPWVQALQPHVGQFTELTGIEVDMQISGEDQYVADLPVTLAGGSSTPDVFMVFAYGQAIESGWLEPLDGYFDDPSLTDLAWYDRDDVFDAADGFVVWPEDGVSYGAPITAEVQTTFYRSDLIEQPPTTFDELPEVAASAHGSDTAGIALRGLASADAVAWPAAGFVFSHDGYLIDENGEARLNSPETIAGVEAYVQVLRDSGPQGVSSWSWLEIINAVQQGQAAMLMDSSNAASDLLDPETSRFADQIMAAPFPSHEGISRPNVWHWITGINAASQNKEAAWLFLQWATSKPTAELIAAGGGTPPRASAWDNAEFRASFGEQAAEVVQEILMNADSSRMKLAWFHPKWPEVGDAFARAVNAALTGSATAEEALNEAQTRAEAALGG